MTILAAPEKPLARHTTYSIEFKRQVARECLGVESLQGLAKWYGICRSLIRIWAAKSEEGAAGAKSGPQTSCRSTRPALPRWSASSGG